MQRTRSALILVFFALIIVAVPSISAETEVQQVPEDGDVLIESGVNQEVLSGVEVDDKVPVVGNTSPIALSEPNTVITSGGAIHPITAINRGRGPDEMIVYTPEYGTYTNTNAWGAEVAVVDGEVVAVRAYGDASLFSIPENGYVLSAHGSARGWLSSNLPLGAKVELTKGGVLGMQMTEPEFFAALDLDYPGLEGVREAVEASDWSAARAELATYLREREHPTWHFDWRDPLAGRTVGAGSITAANDALRKRFTVIEIPHQFEGEIDWAYNPTTQPGSPHAANNEWTWQFNRHHFWQSLGATYQLLKDERYAQAFVEQMTDWVAKNPVPRWADQGAGSRWRTIEVGIRLSSQWPNAFFYFLGSPSFTDEAIATMVRSMVEQARYLYTHQTGGNWLTMEMNGLYHVGVLFPEFKEAAEWRRFAAERMRDDLTRQVYPDGAQYELAPGYHNVSLGNFVGIVDIAQMNDLELPEGYLENLERMFDFNLYMMTPSGSLPAFNDSSGGRPANQLWTGYELFPHRTDFQWGGTNRSIGTPPEVTSYAFPYAGYLIQRSGWDSQARYLAFDVGPYGYGHQHEDKLNFVLSAYGRELVVDAGIYTYDNSKWRQYVLSPYGHNVAFVDGQGQNRRLSRDTFVSDKPAEFEWILTPDYEFAQGSYGSELEGYGATPEWIATHQRSVLYVKEGVGQDFWVIVDTFIPQDEASHRYESIFHLDAPAVTVDEASHAVHTAWRNGANLGIFPMASSGSVAVNVVQGQESPNVQGWIATNSYEVKAVPTPGFAVEGAGVQHVVYVFYPVPSGQAPEVTLSPWPNGVDAADGIGARIDIADGRSYTVFIPTQADASLQMGDMVAEGPVYFERVR